MTKLLRVGYTTLAQSIAKGNLRLDDIETVNLHFNYGQFFDSVLYFVPFGKETLHYQLTPKISYEEIAFSAKRSFWLSALSHLMAVRRRLKSMIDEFRPDVVKICGPHIPAWVFLSVPSVWRCGTVCRIEAYWEDIIDHQTYFPVVIRRLLPLWYRIVYRIFDVYTGTPSLAPEFYVTKGMRRDRIAQWVQDIDLRIIDNSPRVEDSRLAALQPPRIVVVGRLHTEKLPGDALAIFRECVTRGQPGSLIFVGDGPERSALEQDVARYGLSDRAIFLGQQPLHSVIGVMKACDLMIAPMQGTALLEAMATGLAIVAYDHETHRAHIRDGINGRLVPHRDIAAAAAALGELLADPAERRRLAMAARAYVQEKFAYERMVDIMNDGFVRALQFRGHEAQRGKT